MIQAKVIADSKAWTGQRLTTMIVTFPRFILAEFNTHRVFSRNSASSRAIPFAKMVKMVQENPFIPIAWQKDHKGMQGTEYHTDTKVQEATWLEAKDCAVRIAQNLNNQDCNVTKQLCNRLLEPFMWHTIIVSATEWENFFELRCPKYEIDGISYRSKKDAQTHDIKRVAHYEQPHWLKANKGQSEIHMMALAEAMWDAYNESVPKELQPGEWHIPFGDNIDYVKKGYTSDGLDYDDSNNIEDVIKIATARCARISYQTLGDDPKVDYNADIRLHDMLAQSGHWSPFEHCAQSAPVGLKGIIVSAGKGRNFGSSFIQYRAMMENK